MSDVFLLEYRLPNESRGYQLFSDREKARAAGLNFLKGCRKISGKRRAFGDYSDWNEDCIWLASGVTDDAPEFYKGDDQLCERRAEIYELFLDIDDDVPENVYLLSYDGAYDIRHEIFASRALARAAVTKHLVECKVLQGANRFADHADYAGPGCVFWAWEYIINRGKDNHVGETAVIVYEMQLDGPLVGLKPEAISPEKNKQKKLPLNLLVQGMPETKPIEKWQIHCDRIDCDLSQFIHVIETDKEIQEMIAAGMSWSLTPDKGMAIFETDDPAVAALIAEKYGWVWHRDEFDLADDDHTVSAEGLYAKGAYKLHLIFVMPFSDLRAKQIVDTVEKRGFEYAEELVGPMDEPRKPARHQIWFTSATKPHPIVEQTLRTELDAICPNICLIDEINRHDFCNRVRYPGHTGYEGHGSYLGRGLGFYIGGGGGGGGDEDEDDNVDTRLFARRVA